MDYLSWLIRILWLCIEDHLQNVNMLIFKFLSLGSWSMDKTSDFKEDRGIYFCSTSFTIVKRPYYACCGSDWFLLASWFWRYSMTRSLFFLRKIQTRNKVFKVSIDEKISMTCSYSLWIKCLRLLLFIMIYIIVFKTNFFFHYMPTYICNFFIIYTSFSLDHKFFSRMIVWSNFHEFLNALVIQLC